MYKRVWKVQRGLIWASQLWSGSCRARAPGVGGSLPLRDWCRSDFEVSRIRSDVSSCIDIGPRWRIQVQRCVYLCDCIEVQDTVRRRFGWWLAVNVRSCIWRRYAWLLTNADFATVDNEIFSVELRFCVLWCIPESALPAMLTGSSDAANLFPCWIEA